MCPNYWMVTYITSCSPSFPLYQRIQVIGPHWTFHLHLPLGCTPSCIGSRWWWWSWRRRRLPASWIWPAQGSPGAGRPVGHEHCEASGRSRSSEGASYLSEESDGVRGEAVLGPHLLGRTQGHGDGVHTLCCRHQLLVATTLLSLRRSREEFPK